MERFKIWGQETWNASLMASVLLGKLEVRSSTQNGFTENENLNMFPQNGRSSSKEYRVRSPFLTEGGAVVRGHVASSAIATVWGTRLLLGRKAMTNLDSILKSRHYFANKGPFSQSYGFSSSYVWVVRVGL